MDLHCDITTGLLTIVLHNQFVLACSKCSDSGESSGLQGLIAVQLLIRKVRKNIVYKKEKNEKRLGKRGQALCF